MKLTVLIPSEEYKAYAGARIRYGRLLQELTPHGVTLALENIADFSPDDQSYDVLLISKCHDARALVAAAAACGAGKLVGLDLFDDYFSQEADSRLARYRLWLTQLLPNCHYALCSTPVLQEVVGRYRPDLPVHVVNDPAPEVITHELSDTLAAKLVKARSEQFFRLAWFGVGDNPHFRVGLSDLASFSGILSELAGRGMDVELTVLTNARALTADGLALIREVPVRTRVEEWSEAREEQLLREAFACFLPVSAQPFSVAKSLNRAVSALSAGCQVISAGYPLYEPFDELIYRDAGSLVDDLLLNQMKHSSAGIARYSTLIRKLACAEEEAASLAAFLKRLSPATTKDSRPIVLLHGHATNGAAHKAVRALGGFSVGTPYCPADFAFDVVFPACGHRTVMLVSDQSAKKATANLPDTPQTARVRFNRKLWKVAEPDQPSDESIPEDAQWYNAPLTFQLVTYQSTMASIAARMQKIFGPCRLLLSENSAVPFSSRRAAAE